MQTDIPSRREKRTGTNKNVQQQRISFYRNIKQRTFGTRFMQQVIFNHYINKFGTYLFISQRVLHGILQSKRKNAVTLPHSAQRRHAFLEEIKEMSKINKLPSRKKITL